MLGDLGIDQLAPVRPQSRQRAIGADQGVGNSCVDGQHRFHLVFSTGSNHTAVNPTLRSSFARLARRSHQKGTDASPSAGEGTDTSGCFL